MDILDATGSGLVDMSIDELSLVEGGQSIRGWLVGLPVAGIFGGFGMLAYSVGYWS